MVGLNFKENRTSLFANEGYMRMSHQGMAHFAGTGPQGKTCKQCAHFEFDEKAPYNNQRCMKYRELATGKRLAGGKDKIPAKTPSCEYFEGARP